MRKGLPPMRVLKDSLASSAAKASPLLGNLLALQPANWPANPHVKTIESGSESMWKSETESKGQPQTKVQCTWFHAMCDFSHSPFSRGTQSIAAKVTRSICHGVFGPVPLRSEASHVNTQEQAIGFVGKILRNIHGKWWKVGPKAWRIYSSLLRCWVVAFMDHGWSMGQRFNDKRRGHRLQCRWQPAGQL